MSTSSSSKTRAAASCRPDLLILEDPGGRKLPPASAENLLEVFRRYETGATILTSNRPIEDFGAVLGDNITPWVLLDHAEIVHADRRQLSHARLPAAPPAASPAPTAPPSDARANVSQV